MNATTTNPNVPLPAGTHVIGDWDDGHRIISTDAQVAADEIDSWVQR